jgi:hypothetical protein
MLAIVAPRPEDVVELPQALSRKTANALPAIRAGFLMSIPSSVSIGGSRGLLPLRTNNAALPLARTRSAAKGFLCAETQSLQN